MAYCSLQLEQPLASVMIVEFSCSQYSGLTLLQKFSTSFISPPVGQVPQASSQLSAVSGSLQSIVALQSRPIAALL